MLITGNMKTQGEYCVSQCSSGYIDDEEGRNCITCNDTCKKGKSENLNNIFYFNRQI